MDNLEKKLHEYTKSGALPMHMPGHKRNPAMVPGLYVDEDITEIFGFDNLHRPEGIIKDTEEKAASIWNAKSAIISVNGATAPILASVMAAASRGRILVGANCHVSVWHALELSDASYEVLVPETDESFPFCLDTDPAKIASMLDKDPDIKTVIITSPTYEGIVSDIKAVRAVTSPRDVALIVDESHGAHFGLNEYFPSSSKADLVIKSIHKTLHAPTQTAVLLTYSEKIPEEHVRHYMDIFESSSPSYILMSGISRVFTDIKNDLNITERWTDALKKCREDLSRGLLHLKLSEYAGADPSKLVIICGGVINGTDLSLLLREEGIETEAAFDTHIIAMTGIGDTNKSLSRFTNTLLKIDSKLEGRISGSFGKSVPDDEPQIVLPVKSAVTAPYEILPSSNCEGRISADYAYKYPPGIPILIPGQIITKNRLDYLNAKSLKVLRG